MPTLWIFSWWNYLCLGCQHYVMQVFFNKRLFTWLWKVQFYKVGILKRVLHYGIFTRGILRKRKWTPVKLPKKKAQGWKVKIFFDEVTLKAIGHINHGIWARDLELIARAYLPVQYEVLFNKLSCGIKAPIYKGMLVSILKYFFLSNFTLSYEILTF